MDEERLRAERHDRKLWKSRVTGLDDYANSGFGNDPATRRRPDRRQGRTDEEDLEYRLAIEASKNEAEEERKRRDQGPRSATDEDDLAKAIKLSREEEELRKKELENNNAASLFDDTPSQPTQPQATGWNQGYQQQGAVDWFGNPLDQQQQQQSQSTGYLNNAYAQPSGFQNQQTGYPYNQYQQPQQTGFDQSQFQQQQQQPQQQQQFMQPQQTSFGMNNPYAQQSNGFGLQNQHNMQQHQDPNPQPGTQNPWSTTSPSTDPMKPLQTGSNNPFASSFNRPQTSTAAQGKPSLNTLQEQKTQTQFSQPFSTQNSNQQSSPFSSYAQSQHQQQPQQPPLPDLNQQNPHHAQLNALLATGEGQDTFGNVGNLRIPAQHTAPGGFVNSAGSGLGQMPANQTGGNNPFLHNQYTGMSAQQHSAMVPAQTGPAGNFGSSNPFGQPRQGQGQGGSLIDL